MVLRQSCFLLPVVLFVIGCGRTTGTFTVPPSDDGRSLAVIQQISESLPNEDYKLGPGDIIEIKVYGIKDLQATVRIPESGSFDFPLVGSVRAAGVSAPQVEKQIAKVLNERYVNEANVAVFVKEFNSYRISVVGAVSKPGTVVLKKGNCTLVDALAEAGGLTDTAGREVYVTTADASGKRQTTQVDLNPLLEGGDLSLNLSLRPGDSIYVPSSGYVFITGYVKTPGAYPLRKDMTALQAVGTAGDFIDTASHRVRVIRRTSPTQVQVEKIDLADVSAGKRPDLLLLKSDVVEAEPSYWKVPVYGTFNFIKSVFGVGTSLR